MPCSFQERSRAGPSLRSSAVLASLDLAKYEPLFARQEVGLRAARLLTEGHLAELGLPLGPRAQPCSRCNGQYGRLGLSNSLRQAPNL